MAAVKDRGAHLTRSAVVKWSGEMRLTVAIEHRQTAGRRLAGQHPRGHIHQRGPICICPEADRRLARGAAGPAIHLQVVASFGRQKIYRGDRTKLSLCQDRHLRKIGQTVHRRATVQSAGQKDVVARIYRIWSPTALVSKSLRTSGSTRSKLGSLNTRRRRSARSVVPASRDDIRDQLVFQLNHMVFQRQFFLFQPPQRHWIRSPCNFKHMDGFVQITVFATHDLKADPKHVFKAHLTGGIHSGWDIRLAVKISIA